MKNLKLLLIATCITCCSQPNSNEKQEVKFPEINKKQELVEKELPATMEQIAKATISTLFNQPTRIITVNQNGSQYLVKYKRPNDGQLFAYKVKINGHSIIWGTIDGRWRDTSDDEKLSFMQNGKLLAITQTFDDGSKSSEVFNIDSL